MRLRLVPLGGSLDPVHKDSSSNHQEIQEHLGGGGGGGGGRERGRDVIITYLSAHHNNVR